MRGYVLLMALGIGCCIQAKAQSFSLGLEGGVNLSNIAICNNDVKTNGDFLTGARAGSVLDISFGKVSLQPGIFFSAKGYKIEEARTLIVNNLLYNENNKATVRINYIELPFNIQYNFSPVGNGYFFAGAGPYGALTIGGEINSKNNRTLANDVNGGSGITTENNRDLSFGNSSKINDLKGVDAGINLNAGYRFDCGIFFRAATQFGLVNIKPEGTEYKSLRNFNLAFTVGYLFK